MCTRLDGEAGLGRTVRSSSAASHTAPLTPRLPLRLSYAGNGADGGPWRLRRWKPGRPRGLGQWRAACGLWRSRRWSWSSAASAPSRRCSAGPPSRPFPRGAAMGETSAWEDRDTRDALLASVARLSLLEKRLYTKMIVRQLQRDPRVDNELGLYGPDGTVARSCSRANIPYMFYLTVIMTPFAASGNYRVAVPLYLLCLPFFAAGILQSVRSRRLGRQWRLQGGSPHLRCK